ncbi:Chitooligosaccharidolytic beta-N-acetylglucosaminidase [Armadillidium vulgare]|nr:Chitooligosaccharidolytic beta-N-acetylglucosaminidase [Armadillidium vulgare]
MKYLIILQIFPLFHISDKIWAWSCVGDTEDTSECLKERNEQLTGQMSLYTCKLICGKYGSLVPKPRNVTLGKNTIPFLPSQLSYQNVKCEPNVCLLLDQAFEIFKETINQYHPQYSNKVSYWIGPWTQATENNTLVIDFTVNGSEEYLQITTDESYTLNVVTTGTETRATINANTFFGARHALETLSQLIDFDDENDSLQIVSSVSVEDSPTFPYRGFILDTSRNFMSLEKIRKTIDAMSYNKLNRFHWHITDTHSFPLVLNSLPNMASFGAYSSFQTYSPSDVRDLVQYARVRGVQVVPEFDAPAHVGHGWQWGPEQGLGNLVVCLDRKPWTSYCVEAPCGQLNLANEKIYEVLGTLYTEFVDMFSPIEFFHYGGDEVNLNCWNTTQEVTDWMTSNGFGLTADSYYNQWSVFQEKVRQLVNKANGNVEVPGIIWTSHLTEAGHVDKYLNNTNYIIQIWTTGTDPVIKELLQKGYKVIFSNYDAWYLDCGSASWVGKGLNWCSPYKGWQDVYDNDILGLAKNLTRSDQYSNQILGGEAALWTEQADDQTVETKFWPRGAALGERLWTNPSNSYAEADYRMLQHRYRLVTRGVQAERLQPEWCRQNQGQCAWVEPERSP